MSALWGAFLVGLVWLCPGTIILGFLEKGLQTGQDKAWSLVAALGPPVLGAIVGLVYPGTVDAILDENRWNQRNRRRGTAEDGDGPDDDGDSGIPDGASNAGGGD